uniref:Transmembrane protein n=1 Tax=Medicago truncatula TaxID=3880 RepID=I3SPH5_MEDTR|nr:unknown [Medicago truncatula]
MKVVLDFVMLFFLQNQIFMFQLLTLPTSLLHLHHNMSFINSNLHFIHVASFW